MVQPAPKNASPNAGMSMSSAGRFRLASRERLVLHYYNDGGKNKGHCTYGYGTLVHRGLCTVEEMATEVTQEKAEESLNSRQGNKRVRMQGLVNRRHEESAPFRVKQNDSKGDSRQ